MMAPIIGGLDPDSNPGWSKQARMLLASVRLVLRKKASKKGIRYFGLGTIFIPFCWASVRALSRCEAYLWASECEIFLLSWQVLSAEAGLQGFWQSPSPELAPLAAPPNLHAEIRSPMRMGPSSAVDGDELAAAAPVAAALATAQGSWPCVCRGACRGAAAG